MRSDFDLTVTPDRSRAVLTLHSRQIDPAAIRAEIERRKIIAGLRWKRLQAGIAAFQGSDQDSCSIIVAQTKIPAHELILGRQRIALSAIDQRKLKRDLQYLYRMFARPQAGIALPQSVFAKKGDIFCKERRRGQYTDIFGARTTLTLTTSSAWRHTDSVSMCKNGDWFEFRSACDGYVTATAGGELHIVPACLCSRDKMKLYFMVASATSNKAEMLACLHALKHPGTEDNAHDQAEKDALAALSETEGITKILIASGTPPQPGRNARLSIKVDVAKRPDDHAAAMDMKAFSAFHEIAAGTLIAEKQPAVAGVAGLDVYGQSVPTEPVADIVFRAGKNVQAERVGDKLRYVAASDGILYLSDTGAQISEHLEIHHDVGPLTGHVAFGGDIIIGGDVLGGYQVICGQNLICKGTVNDGGRIVCKGDLTVAGGVNGEATDLVAKGRADIGFIQQSRVSVLRDLVVHRSILHANVFCGGVLNVHGNGIAVDRRGCVVGGKIVAMQAMYLQSAGSHASQTQLVCGVNPDGLALIRSIKARIAGLNKRVVRLTHDIGIDLKHPDAIEMINSMGTVQKNEVRDCLLKLRHIAAEQATLQRKLAALEKKSWAPDLQQCVIAVHQRLFAEVRIQIGGALLTLNKETSGAQFTLEGDEIRRI